MEVFTEYYIENWNKTFNGDEAGLEAVLERAGDTVGNNVNRDIHNVSDLPYTLADNVFKAVCAQADYIESNGGLDGFTDTYQSGNVKIGSFSFSETTGSTKGAKLLPAHELCDAARAYLINTGLLCNRAVVV
jgi:hypothetical protein